MNTKVNLCGIELDNPVIPASGTFGFGKEFAELYDINILGTFSFKGTTLDPRFVTPPPASPNSTAVCSMPWVCRTPVWRRSSPTSCPG